jgi:hypothetical protein
MADDKRIEGRTTYIEENMPDGMLKKAAVGISRLGDAVGFTQEDKYKGKTREEIAKKPMPEKKAKGNSGGADSDGMKKGGMVGSASKRADGCAQRGKTKGRMV